MLVVATRRFASLSACSNVCSNPDGNAHPERDLGGRGSAHSKLERTPPDARKQTLADSPLPHPSGPATPILRSGCGLCGALRRDFGAPCSSRCSSPDGTARPTVPLPAPCTLSAGTGTGPHRKRAHPLQRSLRRRSARRPIPLSVPVRGLSLPPCSPEGRHGFRRRRVLLGEEWTQMGATATAARQQTRKAPTVDRSGIRGEHVLHEFDRRHVLDPMVDMRLAHGSLGFSGSPTVTSGGKSVVLSLTTYGAWPSTAVAQIGASCGSSNSGQAGGPRKSQSRTDSITGSRWCSIAAERADTSGGWAPAAQARQERTRHVSAMIHSDHTGTKCGGVVEASRCSTSRDQPLTRTLESSTARGWIVATPAAGSAAARARSPVASAP